MVKAVLTAIPLHVLIALNVPKWFVKAIDKFHKGFLWKGSEDAKGGNCPVSCSRVTRPLQLGGLGIHDLEIFGWALLMRWLLLQKMDPERLWNFLCIQVLQQVQHMFAASVQTTIEDGSNTCFWTDRWLDGQSIQNVAPTVLPFVRRQGWKTLTVAEALQDNRWANDITGSLSVLAIWRCV